MSGIIGADGTASVTTRTNLDAPPVLSCYISPDGQNWYAVDQSAANVASCGFYVNPDGSVTIMLAQAPVGWQVIFVVAHT